MTGWVLGLAAGALLVQDPEVVIEEYPDGTPNESDSACRKALFLEGCRIVGSSSCSS